MVASAEPIEFQPAEGCTDATDFIVRCFVARLRIGVIVKKHGRNRGALSGNRALFIHPDGISLTWKHENGSSLRQSCDPNKTPRLDLRKCIEVRHASSVDPLDPRFTGTAVLRKKSSPDEIHRSFSLIFPERTLDLTAFTIDQYLVLVQGFSALCYRLNLATQSPSSLQRFPRRSLPMYIEFDNIANVKTKADESSSAGGSSSNTHLMTESYHSDLCDKNLSQSPRPIDYSASFDDAMVDISSHDDTNANHDCSISVASLRDACDVSTVLHVDNRIPWF